MSNRRRFLETAAANAAAIAIAPAAALAAIPRDNGSLEPVSSTEWDFTWTDRVKGKHRAVFDCTEPESGAGVWRASVWRRQYIEHLKATDADLTRIIVLRHDAIILAMQQTFWDKYGIGAAKHVTDLMTQQPTGRNPVLPPEGGSGEMNPATLPAQIASGAIVLACNLAFGDCIDLIAKKEKVSEAEARKRAVGYLVPGVILQPSGVFAVVRAQEAGSSYVKAS